MKKLPKVILLGALLSVSAGLTGCEKIMSWPSEVYDSFFGSSDQTPQKTKKASKPSNKQSDKQKDNSPTNSNNSSASDPNQKQNTKNKNEADPNNKTSSKKDLTKEQITEKQNSSKENTSSATQDKQKDKKEKLNVSSKTKSQETAEDNNAPLASLFKIGGRPNFIKADETFLYASYPHAFYIFDKNFRPLAQTALHGTPIALKRFVNEGKSKLFIKEKIHGAPGYTFEMIPVGTVNSEESFINAQQSVDLDNNFAFIDEKKLALFTKNSTKIVEIASNDDLLVDSEISGGPAQDLLVHKSVYLIARGSQLDVYDLKQQEITATLSLSRNFKFLGIRKSADGKDILWLGLFDKEMQTFALQSLKLSDEGISQFDKILTFPTPLSKVSFSNETGLLVGFDEETQALQVFSTEHEKLLRGPLVLKANPKSWSFDGANLVLSTDDFTGILHFQLDEQVIRQADALQKFQGINKNLPLAQVGATKIVKDEYSLTPVLQTDFLANSYAVNLLGPDRLLFVSESSQNSKQNLFKTLSLQNEDSILEPVGVPDNVQLSRFTSTSLGVFALSQEGKLYFSSIDLNMFTELPIAFSGIYHFEVLNYNNTDYLLIAQKNIKGSSWSLLHLLSPSQIQPVKQVTDSERVFPLYLGDNQILLVNSKAFELHHFSLLMGLEEDPEQKTSLIESLNVSDLNLTFEALKLAPNAGTLLAYTQTKENFSIKIINLLDLKNQGEIKPAHLSKHQFYGSTFSNKGHVFVLPTSEGTLFYDLSRPEAPQLLRQWEQAAYSADVAAGGGFLCIAQGSEGLSCGRPRF